MRVYEPETITFNRKCPNCTYIYGKGFVMTYEGELCVVLRCSQCGCFFVTAQAAPQYMKKIIVPKPIDINPVGWISLRADTV